MAFPVFQKIVTKLRVLLWFVVALGSRYKKTFIVFAVGSFFLSATTVVFAPRLNEIFVPPKTLRVGYVGDYTTTVFPLEIQNTLSLGLTRLNSEGQAIPAVAKSWEISPDGKTYKFHLRDNLAWQDGKKFKAKDVNYNFKNIESKVLDDTTIEFHLKEPFSPFPTLLAQPLFKKGLIGLGEYKIISLKIEGKNIQSLTVAPVKKTKNDVWTQYKFYPTLNEATLAFKLGELDTLNDVLDVSAFNSWPLKISRMAQFNRYTGVFYSMNDGLLSEKAIRQALTYALPATSDQVDAISPISPTSWAYNPEVKPYTHDIDAAKVILNKTSIATKSAEKKITLTIVPALNFQAELIAKSWEELGFKTEIKREAAPKKFQVLLAVQEIPADPDQYSFWHSTQKEFNITGYQNPRIDKLLEDGRKLTSYEDRLPKYLDFQKYLVDDAPVAFWYYPETFTVSRH